MALRHIGTVTNSASQPALSIGFVDPNAGDVRVGMMDASKNIC